MTDAIDQEIELLKLAKHFATEYDAYKQECKTESEDKTIKGIPLPEDIDCAKLSQDALAAWDRVRTIFDQRKARRPTNPDPLNPHPLVVIVIGNEDIAYKNVTATKGQIPEPHELRGKAHAAFTLLKKAGADPYAGRIIIDMQNGNTTSYFAIII